MKFTAALLLILLSVACAHRSQEEKSVIKSASMTPAITRADALSHAKDWPHQQRQILTGLLDTYGPPQLRTFDSLVWYHRTGPWVKSVLRKDLDKTPLEQTAALKVPEDKVGDITLFDKSIFVDPTTKHPTTSAELPELNHLVLRLTEEIVDGSISPMEARRRFQEERVEFLLEAQEEME